MNRRANIFSLSPLQKEVCVYPLQNSSPLQNLFSALSEAVLPIFAVLALSIFRAPTLDFPTSDATLRSQHGTDLRYVDLIAFRHRLTKGLERKIFELLKFGCQKPPSYEMSRMEFEG